MSQLLYRSATYVGPAFDRQLTYNSSAAHTLPTDSLPSFKYYIIYSLEFDVSVTVHHIHK